MPPPNKRRKQSLFAATLSTRRLSLREDSAAHPTTTSPTTKYRERREEVLPSDDDSSIPSDDECPKVTYEEEIDQRMYCDLDQRVMEAWGDCGLEDEPLDNGWVPHEKYASSFSDCHSYYDLYEYDDYQYESSIEDDEVEEDDDDNSCDILPKIRLRVVHRHPDQLKKLLFYEGSPSGKSLVRLLRMQNQITCYPGFSTNTLN